MRVQLLVCSLAWALVGVEVGFPSARWALLVGIPGALVCSWFVLDVHRILVHRAAKTPGPYTLTFTTADGTTRTYSGMREVSS